MAMPKHVWSSEDDRGPELQCKLSLPAQTFRIFPDELLRVLPTMTVAAGGACDANGGLRLTRSCEGRLGSQGNHKRERSDGVKAPKLQSQPTVTGVPAASTTKDGYVGDVGRWQQRLGIAMGGGCGIDGGLREEGKDRTGSLGEPVTTARELMGDGALREAFAARGRHKKSPVLAREVWKCRRNRTQKRART